MENSLGLVNFMGNWLAGELKLEARIFPSISRAFRVGKIREERPSHRDVIITLADFRTKSKIQNLGRANNRLYSEGKKILVFLDLPPEALAIRKTLKPTIQRLQEANLKYHWCSPRKLEISYCGKTYYAWDVASGRLLHSINIVELIEVEKRSFKRKLYSNGSA